MAPEDDRIPPGLDVACHLNVLIADPASDALAPALDALAAHGYRRVVLPPVDPAAFDAAGMRALCDVRGITAIPIAVQAPDADVSSADPWIRKAGRAALEAAVDLAEALGSDQLNGVPYGLFARPAHETPKDAWRRAAAAVGAVADEAHARGITMTFEVLNRYETATINTAEQAMRFCTDSGSAHLGIHLDTFHMAVEEADMSAAIRAALPRLRYLELGQSGRGPLASGSVDIERVIRQAIADGYRGRWGVEAFSARVLPRPARESLAIWRAPYDDGARTAADAAAAIRRAADTARA
ncbi:sugar phosphate isomerase/epimerase family protein [Microbacterium karelineae]|uniref:sugar phosphate isomerase/epimerase family protein n=1 Tax=Microbacterium karelineae TaxID=2654283 RepID=UPI0012EA3AB5|nr:sugar phosphate isomerase/epimerase family protein [Microbacterium karelineae]